MVIQQRKNRLTGSTISVIDDRDNFVGYGGPWVTFCDTHGQFVVHDTRADAVAWAADPTVWCPDCQDQIKV